MTNELVTVTNVVSRDITGLDVVNSVNGFYSTAFDHILWLLGALILLLGIAVPLAFYFFQKRQLALREKGLFDRLEEKTGIIAQSLSKANAEFLEAEKVATQEKLQKLEEKIENQLFHARAGIFRLQANIELTDGHRAYALEDYTNAIENCIKASELTAVQNDLRFLAETALPQMEKGDFSDSTLVAKLNAALKLAEEIKCEQLLKVDIENVKKALAEAQKREKK